MSSELEARGWRRVEPVDGDDLDLLREEFARLFDERAGRVGHENVAELDAESIAGHAALATLLNRVETEMAAASPRLKFAKLWLVRSTADTTSADTVPFLPHIDRSRYVKGMVYLDDVGIDDGPLTIASCPPERMESRRRALGPDYKARGENVVTEALEYEPLPGPAGSLTLFDTNCPHHAGRVAVGGERRALRFDFCDPAWNRTSMIARVARRLLRR